MKAAAVPVTGGTFGAYLLMVAEVAMSLTAILGFFSVAVGLYVGLHRALEIRKRRKTNAGELPEDEE